MISSISRIFSKLLSSAIMNKERVATMTHFCTFGTVTPVLIIGFGWLFFKSIDLEVKQIWCKFQAHCLTLTLEREWNVKTFFVCHCAKSQATMTHPLTTMTHIWKALKTVRLLWHNWQKIFKQKDCVLLTDVRLL